MGIENAGLYYGGGAYGGWPGFGRRYNLTRYLLGYPGYERPPCLRDDAALPPAVPVYPYGYGGYGGYFRPRFGRYYRGWRRGCRRRAF